MPRPHLPRLSLGHLPLEGIGHGDEELLLPEECIRQLLTNALAPLAAPAVGAGRLVEQVVRGGAPIWKLLIAL
eukprot:scaffold14370_cov72-Phaeocystis_antarctica.AAC.6